MKTCEAPARLPHQTISGLLGRSDVLLLSLEFKFSDNIEVSMASWFLFTRVFDAG